MRHWLLPTALALPAVVHAASLQSDPWRESLGLEGRPPGVIRVSEFGILPEAGFWTSNLLLAGQGDPALGEPAPVGQEKSIWRELFGCDVRSDRLWSFEFGVGVVSDNTLSDYLEPKLNKLHGPGGGVTYNFTVARRVYEFDWNVGSLSLRPQIEIPARLTLVDENSGRLIPDLNLGIVLRWQDFPWNRYLRTTLAAGPGLSYSFQPWTADFQRHEEEDEDRSRLKFWLPIEFTVALPRYPGHQLVAFIDHQSGGRILDRGGVDAWGLGYRFEF